MTAACPIAAAQDALTLLRRGRAAMALSVLEHLPELIEGQLRDAHGSGFARGWDAHLSVAARDEAFARARTTPAAQPIVPPALPGPAKALPAAARPIVPALPEPSRLDVLRAALADPELRARLRVALRVRDLDDVASGRAQLSRSRWCRALEAIALTDDNWCAASPALARSPLASCSPFRQANTRLAAQDAAMAGSVASAVNGCGARCSCARSAPSGPTRYWLDASTAAAAGPWSVRQELDQSRRPVTHRGRQGGRHRGSQLAIGV
jgi:hypothetical protein